MLHSDDLDLKLDEVIHQMPRESPEKPTRSVDDSPLGPVDLKRGLRRRFSIRGHSCLGLKNNGVCLTPQAEVCGDADVGRSLRTNHFRVGDHKAGLGEPSHVKEIMIL